MEVLSLIENILRHNVLQGHISWVTLVKNLAASSFFLRGVISARGRAGHLTSIRFLSRAMLSRRAKLPYGILKISPNKSS